MNLSEQDPEVTTKTDDEEGAAPDAETQSGAASEAGNRTDEAGSRAPSDPAEGA